MTSSASSGRRHSAVAVLVVPAAVVVAGGLLALRLYFQPPTVPTYEVAAPAEETTLRPGDHFEVTIRPTSPVTGAVGARGFLLRGNEVRPWEPSFEVAQDGSIRIAGTANVLFVNVPAGPWEIAVAVGRPETLPTAPRDVLRRRDADIDAGSAAWRLVRMRIHLGG